MNKSEELCRLLNIPKKYRGSRWEFIDRTYFVDSQIFDAEEDAKSYNNEEEFSVEELSVDLTKPSNFVKLLFFKFPNFNNEYYNILEFMSDNFIEIENINEYIESLYNQLKIDDKRIIKDLANQAQATKWDY